MSSNVANAERQFDTLYLDIFSSSSFRHLGRRSSIIFFYASSVYVCVCVSVRKHWPSLVVFFVARNLLYLNFFFSCCLARCVEWYSIRTWVLKCRVIGKLLLYLIQFSDVFRSMACQHLFVSSYFYCAIVVRTTTTSPPIPPSRSPFSFSVQFSLWNELMNLYKVSSRWCVAIASQCAPLTPTREKKKKYSIWQQQAWTTSRDHFANAKNWRVRCGICPIHLFHFLVSYFRFVADPIMASNCHARIATTAHRIFL